jgi:isopentenyl phosphate kinase
MTEIDYRTRAYERAESFLSDLLKENPNALFTVNDIKYAFTMGYYEGTTAQIDITQGMLKKIDEKLNDNPT